MSKTYKAFGVSTVGAGLGLFLIILIIALLLGALFWGWVIMLVWPLVASSTIGFGKAFWLGLVATLIIGAISKN